MNNSLTLRIGAALTSLWATLLVFNGVLSLAEPKPSQGATLLALAKVQPAKAVR